MSPTAHNPRSPRRVPPIVAGLLLLFCGTAAPSMAQAPPATAPVDPDALFVAFAYNFCLFTSWTGHPPTHPPEPFIIVVAGDKIPSIALLEKRQVHHRPIVVRSLPLAADLPEECDVLVCNGLEKKRRDALLAQAAKRPILTMSRSPGFCAAGGIVEFFVQDNKMRFRVSRRNMKRSGVHVQSRLLKLAVIVPGKQGGN